MQRYSTEAVDLEKMKETESKLEVRTKTSVSFCVHEQENSLNTGTLHLKDL